MAPAGCGVIERAEQRSRRGGPARTFAGSRWSARFCPSGATAPRV